MKNYYLVPKDNRWYTVSDKVDCALDVKEELKIAKLGNYNLESIEKYYKYLKQSDREKELL